MYTIKVKLDEDEIILPKYESEGASGLDARAWKYSLPGDIKKVLDFPTEGYVLNPHERMLIRTGIHVELPQNLEFQIRPRSGLAFNYGIISALGTIDEDYRGDIGVILINTSNKPFVVKENERYGQLVLMKVEKFRWNLVEDELSETDRGHDGFNSTGLK